MKNIITKVYESILKVISFVIKPIFKLIELIPVDKQLHYLVGYKFSSLVFFLFIIIPTLFNSVELWQIGLLSFFITAFPAVGKEIKDLKLDVIDILATMLGGLVSAIQNTILIYILLK